MGLPISAPTLYRKVNMLKNCKYCKKEFNTDHNIAKYCSRECWRLSKIISDKTERNKWGKFNNLFIRDCKVCGYKFITRKSDVYCSDECRKQLANIKSKQRSITNHIIKTIKCKECDTYNQLILFVIVRNQIILIIYN